ncbi:MAG: hypothetical protein LC660_14825 [Desulfobacteraceae bacterium]|nr:hypothetical protein [Desulfobacteraceae bacterium]
MWRFNKLQDIEVSEIEAELRRFELAVAEVLRDLKNVSEQVAEEIDEDLSAIFQAHMAMVNDNGLKAEVKKKSMKNRSARAARSVLYSVAGNSVSAQWMQRLPERKQTIFMT